ncbi:carboxymethylenebutenolidase [Pacificimonas flava]|uniref:Carboxymethylenebutenolidase n=2 Tax=Pacificimonas TaxID=1960290 RepID=A0A219B4I3_9SPHN|nr:MULTISPECIES: dienelactone hydrolase family protein [Pacificimonas]MBZ6377624.1 dienelactone hydrolase family protein [Pacificimonas aurantium]OWV32688.1 carboxymethylenebutenolidase [Pacificimonas flava]
MGETVNIKALDGSGEFAAYLAKPATDGPAPSVVVIQEIFGVNEGIRKKCDKLAADGYVAIAPDLFWRQEPGVDLTDKSKEEWDRAFDLMNGFDADKGVEDIEATIKVVRGHDATGDKVGCVGYCLGGKLAYMTAARTDIDASVGYYGVGIDEMLDEAKAIANPLLLHVAEEDGFVDKDAQAKMHQALDPHPKVTLHDYPGCDHAFAREDGISRVEAAAKLADERTMAFFKQHLG